ncbi:MAG: alpha/beta hydrolase [Chitinophagales bacterium]
MTDPVSANAIKEAEKNSKSNAREAGKSGDSLDYYLNLDLPTRDIVGYEKSGGRMPVTQHLRDIISSSRIGGNGYYPYTCGNGMYIMGYPGAPCGGNPTGRTMNNANVIDCPFYINDPWNNKIYALGNYGPDARNYYYVYLPTNFNANSKVVVLIHGGGWTTGPNPDEVNGWGSTYTVGGTSNITNEQNQNIVKNLLANGYVVVSLLYRLVQYGDNNTDIMANTITINDQINDVDAAIQHIHTNFPSCLSINANNIQVLGESAGAHLALMFAYTRANTSYVKSVVSVAGPTNMNQMANWIMNRPFNFPCGTDFVIDNPNVTTLTHFPFYGIHDPIAAATNHTITGFVNPLTCTVANIKAGLFIIQSPASANTQKRVTNSYNLAQSCVRQIVTNPGSNAAFQNISPCSVLTAARIVPTFIIHGTDDWLVPFKFSTNNMHAALNTIGGVKDSCNSTGKSLLGLNSPALPKTISTTYPATGPRHVIKTYTGSNHDVSNASPSASTVPTTTNGQSLAQLDILTWFNGH